MNYEHIAEVDSDSDSDSVGPHDIARLPWGKLLVVANGGTLTHPDTGRAKLNLANMDPSITILDARGVGLSGNFQLGRRLHQLIIHYLALGKDGSVFLAMQDEGPIGRRDHVGDLSKG